MNGKNFYSLAVSIAVAALGLSGCSDYDNDFSANEIQFAENFTSFFGNVDPNQDWVALDGGSVCVFVEESSKIQIYAEGLGTNLLLREAYVEAGKSITIGYDAPVGVKSVSVVAKSDKDWQAKSVAVAENVKVVFAKKTTRSAVATYSPQPRHKIDYVGGSYTIDGTEGVMQGYFESTFLPAKTWNNSIQYSINDGWGAYYATNVWPITSEKITDRAPITNSTAIMSLPYTAVTIGEIQQKAIQNIYANTEGNTKLKEHTHDFSIYTKESGPITLTYVYGVTAGKGGLGYCYTRSNTPEAVKSAPKYMLFVNEQDLASGQQYHLTFYGEDGNGTPTLEFPEGYYINFFVLTSTDGSGLQAWHASEIDITTPMNGYSTGNPGQGEPVVYNDVYGVNNAHMAIYSQIALNDNVSNLIGSGTYKAASTAAWSTLGYNCLSFEDFPDADGVNSDWNDICFLFDANVDDFKTVDESIDYMVACEDLGNTYDFDYNDIVFKVGHITVTTYTNGEPTGVEYQPLMDISLEAAGGTLPAKVWYDVDEDDEFTQGVDIVIFDEVHSAFGVSTSTMVNTNWSKGVKKAPVHKVIELKDLYPNDPEAQAEEKAAGWRISDNASHFKITVSNPRNSGDVTIGDETVVYDVDETISVPLERGSIPSAFIVPTSESGNKGWKWPNEKQRINAVYPGWGDWVASREIGSKWYDEDNWWGHSADDTPVDPTPEKDPVQASGITTIDIIDDNCEIPNTACQANTSISVTFTIDGNGYPHWYIHDGNYHAVFDNDYPLDWVTTESEVTLYVKSSMIETVMTTGITILKQGEARITKIVVNAQ